MSRIVHFPGRASETDNFEALMRPHFADIYRAARRLTASDADAEDLVQEVCLKAWGQRAEFARMEFQRAWLLRILYNRFIDDQRRRERSPVHLALLPAANDAADYPGPEHRQPEREVEHMMRVQSVQSAMKFLGREQRVLLALHDIDGLTLGELQAMSGLPVGTIKSKLHRARVKLGRLLEREQAGKQAARRDSADEMRRKL